MDSLAEAIADQPATASTTERIVCRARANIKRGHVRLNESITRSPRLVPPSSPAPDRRHPLVTSHFKRCTEPLVSMPPNQRSRPDSSMASARARAPYVS